MKRHPVLTLVLAFIAAALLANAPVDAGSLRMHGDAGDVPPVSCPQVGDNGCSTSPGGTFQTATLFTGYTGTSYPVRPGYNVPGNDYASGMPVASNPSYSIALPNGYILTGSCGTATMVDPATVSPDPSSNNPGCGKMPKDCAWTNAPVSTQLSPPAITCDNTSDDVVIKGFDLGPVGGHLGTYIRIENSVTGKGIVAFNNLEMDESTYVRGGPASWGAGSTGDIVWFANNMLGNWADDWSEQGLGTGAQSGTTLTISACSSCNFRVGQTLGYSPSQVNNNFIYAQLTGTGGAACPDPTCNGGVGTYQVAQSATRTTQTVESYFQMGGGIGCNTSGSIIFWYNYAYQMNGRLGTCSQRQPNEAVTNIPIVSNRYNFTEGGVYVSGISHYEMLEYVIQDGNVPLQWDRMENIGNVALFPSTLATNSTTGFNFVSTGAVNGTVQSNFAVTYDDYESSENVVICNGGAQSAACLDSMSGGGSGSASGKPYSINTLTSNNNYIRKDATGYYSLGNGALGGSSAATFFVGAQSGTTLTVTAFSGGVPIAVGMRVWETGVKIVGLGTGSGGTGTYLMETTCSTSCGSGNRRAAFDVIGTVASATGNYDLESGTLLTLPSLIAAQTNSSPFTYPGMR